MESAVKRKRQAVADFLAAHPAVDQLAPLGIVAAWLLLLAGSVPPSESPRMYIYAAVSTLSALVLAAATFVCTLTYQSSSTLVRGIRRRFATELRKNWSSILLGALGCAVLPIAAMAIDEHYTQIAFGFALYGLTLLIVKFSRSVFWLKYTLFMQEASTRLPEIIELRPPTRRTTSSHH